MDWAVRVLAEGTTNSRQHPGRDGGGETPEATRRLSEGKLHPFCLHVVVDHRGH